MVTYAIDHGITAMAATTVLSVAGLAFLSGKIIGGLVADRVGAKRTLVVGLAIRAVAVSLYVFTRDLQSFYALALMFGIGLGAVAIAVMFRAPRRLPAALPAPSLAR